MFALQGQVKKNLSSYEKEKKAFARVYSTCIVLDEANGGHRKKTSRRSSSLSLSLSSNSNILCEHARASEKKYSESKRRERESARGKKIHRQYTWCNIYM